MANTVQSIQQTDETGLGDDCPDGDGSSWKFCIRIHTIVIAWCNRQIKKKRMQFMSTCDVLEWRGTFTLYVTDIFFPERMAERESSSTPSMKKWSSFYLMPAAWSQLQCNETRLSSHWIILYIESPWSFHVKTGPSNKRVSITFRLYWWNAWKPDETRLILFSWNDEVENSDVILITLLQWFLFPLLPSFIPLVRRGFAAIPHEFYSSTFSTVLSPWTCGTYNWLKFVHYWI